MSETEYSSTQVEDARRLAKALSDVNSDKRSLFRLLLDGMLIGAEAAEQCMKAEQKCTHTS